MTKKKFGQISIAQPIALLAMIVALQGCDKDSGTDLTGKALLTSVHWKISSAEGTFTVKLGSIPILSDEFSVTDSLDSCEKDDYISFSPDNSFKVIDGGDRCEDSPEDGILESGNYEYEEENNRIAIDLLQDDLEGLPDGIFADPWFEVKELDAQIFRLTKSIDESFSDKGVTYNVSAVINLTMVPVLNNCGCSQDD
jgi:hypothetical protein